MKLAAVFLLAFIACAVAGPVKVTDNNVGDIVSVKVDANLDISNKVDQTLVNVIVAYLNSQSINIGRGGSDSERPGNDLPPAPLDDLKMIDELEELLKK
jgi:hypothetical protein